MKNVRKNLAVVLAVVSFGMLAGCGGGDDPAPTTATKATTATVTAPPAGSPAGSVATAAVVTAQSASGATITTIPANTVITPSGGTLAAGPITLNVVTPATVGDISGMVKPVGTTIVSALGAVDISIAGTTGFTVGGAGLTVNIPVKSCPSATGVPVTVVRNSGATYPLTATCAANIATVTGVTQFSSIYVSPTTASQ